MRKQWMIFVAAVTAFGLTACGNGDGIVINGTTAAEEGVQTEESSPDVSESGVGTKIEIVTDETEAESSIPESASISAESRIEMPESTAGTTAWQPSSSQAATSTPVQTTAAPTRPALQPTTAAAKTYKVTDVKKTMYATASVRVRSSYSTSSEVLAGLQNGEKVEVTGESENGWMRVNYNGHVGYVSKDYLTETAPKTTASQGSSSSQTSQSQQNTKPTTTTDSGTTPGSTTTGNKTSTGSGSSTTTKPSTGGSTGPGGTTGSANSSGPGGSSSGSGSSTSSGGSSGSGSSLGPGGSSTGSGNSTSPSGSSGSGSSLGPGGSSSGSGSSTNTSGSGSSGPGGTTSSGSTSSSGNSGSVTGNVTALDPSGVTIQTSSGSTYQFTWGENFPALAPGEQIQIFYETTSSGEKRVTSYSK